MPTYTINGQLINYEEHGPANGPIANIQTVTSSMGVWELALTLL